MVQSGGGPLPVARLNHTQVDHSGARGTLPHRTPLPREIISPHSYRPTKLKIPYLQRRRSSGRCGDYGDIGQTSPP